MKKVNGSRSRVQGQRRCWAGGVVGVLCVALSIALVAAAATAGPFLSSDPNPAHTKYQVRLSSDNGATWGQWAEAPPYQEHLWMDLSGVSPGTYKGEVQGFGTWSVTDMTGMQTTTIEQWSPSAPFLLTAPPGVKVKIEK